MGFNSNTINFKAGLDTSRVATGVQKIEGHMSGLSKSVNKIQRSFGALGAAIAGAFAINTISDFSRSAVNAASDLNETIGKTQQIFGSSSYEIERFAKIASSSLGLSQRAAMDGASTFAVFGKAAGLTGSELTKFSIDLVKLSADLASFYNTSPEEAIVAIGAALRGEAEPIRRYGVLLNDATLKQIAFDNGITTSIKEALTPQKKALAANLAIFEQTKDAQGDFSRTSDGLANSTRILNAELENSKAILGQELLPLLTEFVQKVTPALRDLMKYGRAAVGTMSSSDIRRLEEEQKANAAKESTVKLQEQLNNEQQLYNKLVKSQSFVITNEEYRDRIRFKAKFNALREEYDMRVRIANESINQALAQKKVTEVVNEGVVLSLQSLNDQMKLLKETQLTGPISDFQKLQHEIDALQAKIDRLTGKSLQNAKEEAKKFNESLEFKSGVGFSEAIANALNPPKSALEERMAGINEEMRVLGENLPQIDQMWDNTITSMQAKWEAFAQSFKDMIDGFITESIYEFANTLGRALGGAEGAFDNFGQKMLMSFGQFLEQMGKMFIAFGVAKLALSNALQPQNIANPASAVQLIAAGAAMAAIGGVITASMSKFAETGTTGAAGVPSQSFNDGYNFQSRIDGYDIVIVTDRNQKLRNRRG